MASDPEEWDGSVGSDGSWNPSHEDIRQEQEDNLSRYKVAGKVINAVMKMVIPKCQAGTKITDICITGDNGIKEQCENRYPGVLSKGIAFPTCVPINNKICSFCPLENDETVLHNDDMIKIEMGCHIDGCIAMCAHTHKIVDGRVTGEAAHVTKAADIAAQVAMQLARPGKKIIEVNEAIHKVSAAYGCTAVKGFGCRKLERHQFGGNQVLAGTMVDDTEFEENQAYTIDVIISSGEGIPKQLDNMCTTVFRNVLDNQYHLSDFDVGIFKAIDENFGSIPFSVRAVQSLIRNAIPRLEEKLWTYSCDNLLEPFQILEEKQGVHIARVKFSVCFAWQEATAAYIASPTGCRADRFHWKYS